MDRGRNCRHCRRQHLHLGAVTQHAQLCDPGFLRYRAHAAWNLDLLGHRRHQLSRRTHHRGSGLGQCRSEIPAHDRCVCDAGAAVRRDSADLDAVRQGPRHLSGQCPYLRFAHAGLAVFRCCVGRRRLRGAVDRDPHLPADFLSGSDARSQDQAGGVGRMSTDAVAILGFIALFALMLLRVPVGMAMGLVGVCGFSYLVSGSAALKMVGHSRMPTLHVYTFGFIPMFLLMGIFVSNSGMSRELFRAANGFVGHLRGGLGIATVAACGGFAGICGSSVATAATFSAVAYPEMRRFGYPESFATGVIAAGGTLGAMLPPSTVLAVYGIITEQDIGKLFMAGIIPGILAMTMYMITISLIGYLRPGFLPTGPQTTWRERFAGLKNIWAPVLLFVFVIGGLYGLPFLPRFTPTEAGGVGATGAFLIGVFTGRLDKDKILAPLLQATRTAAAVVTVLIGALIFRDFLPGTQTPQKGTEVLTCLGLGSYGVLALIMVMYLVLGCLMDAMAMIILTVPIIFPVISHLGFDPIWFGVIIVMTVELGLIHPPVGMNVFVIKSVVKDVSFATIFKGVIPFVATDLIRLGMLIAFPLLATFLPTRMMAH